MLRVQQLMTQNVYVCRPDDSLSCAARLMWEEDIGVVPVVDGERRVVAMVTDRDVCMGAYTTDRPLSQIRVREVMSKEVFSVHPEQPIEDAEDIMREHQVRRLPVTDASGRIVGILSQNDLIQEAARQREARVRELGAIGVTATLASIGRSRAGELSTAVLGASLLS